MRKSIRLASRRSGLRENRAMSGLRTSPLSDLAPVEVDEVPCRQTMRGFRNAEKTMTAGRNSRL